MQIVNSESEVVRCSLRCAINHDFMSILNKEFNLGGVNCQLDDSRCPHGLNDQAYGHIDALILKVHVEGCTHNSSILDYVQLP